jgi:S1-C subfamily serine protease
LRQVELAERCRRRSAADDLADCFYEFKNEQAGRPPVFLTILGSHALAISMNEDYMEEVLLKEAGRLTTSFRNAAFQHAMTRVHDDNSLWMAALGKALTDNTGRTLQQEGVESIAAGFRLADRLEANLTAKLKDGSDPAVFAARIRLDMLQAKGYLLRSSETRRELAPLAELVGELIEHLEAVAAGATVTFKTAADLDRLPANWADGETPIPVENRELYRRLLRSTVWVADPVADKCGAGFVILPQSRLVLTCRHVADAGRDVVVFFPMFENERVIAERERYLSLLKAGQGIRGRVVAADRLRDLALIRLETMPKGVEGAPPAHENAFPAQIVHSVGNPDVGAFWVYSQGAVRQVVSRKMKDPSSGAPVEARVILTDSPLNPGDSGGPLVNSQGELLGIAQSVLRDRENRIQRTSLFVELTEIEAFLKENGFSLR